MRINKKKFISIQTVQNNESAEATDWKRQKEEQLTKKARKEMIT